MNVIICAHNRLESLCRILAVLSEQTILPRVTVVDDSDEPIMQQTNLKYPSLYRYIWIEPDGLYHRVGKYNLALGIVRGPTILLDDDVIPEGNQFIEGYTQALENAVVVRGAWISDGKPNKIPWFSTANIGMLYPILFDGAYDGRYGYDDFDFEQTVTRRDLPVAFADDRTACVHLGPPFAGDRSGTETNERYFREKWNIR